MLPVEWYDDPEEVVAFASWYYEGTGSVRPSEIIDMFEKPWKWTEEYQGYKLEQTDATV